MRQDVKQQLITYIIDNQEKFYRLAYSYVHDREEAMDVVQNAIVKVLEKHEGIREASAIKTWFYCVLMNESLNSLSKKKREVNWEPEEFQDIPAKEQSQPDDDLYNQIDRLPTNLKTVIILRFYEDLTLEEIAKVTKTSLSTVKYRLYAGLKKLRVFLKEEENQQKNIKVDVNYEMKSQSDKAISFVLTANESSVFYWVDDPTMGGFEGITENTHFYINEAGNPVVVFEKYEVAPGAMGRPEFEIIIP